jgi:TPP-dependent pyruvate/acetoin dehydrogenase alpha subunit
MRRKERSCRLIVEDPIRRAEDYLLKEGFLDGARVEEMRARIKAEVDEAANETDARPVPGGSNLLAHTYAQDRVSARPSPPNYLSDQEITMIDAINHGLRE